MGLFDFFKKANSEKNEQQKNNSNEQLDDFTRDIAKSSEQFISNVSDKFQGLDFSVPSLEIVDKILDEASEFYPEMNEAQQKNLISAAGSYVFEVARRNYGGKYFWYDKLNQPIFVTGMPNFEVSILAFEKVKGRLQNGKEDNIPFYFAGFIERVQKKQSGMIV